jgi:AbiV family abortive infection protein
MKRKRPIERYEGRLSPSQLAEGMNAARRNARRLYEDATLLARENRFPTACSLAILSIEESGKLAALRGIANAPPEQLKNAWRGYRDHQAKNASWMIGDLAAKGAKTLQDLKPLFDPKSDHPAVLDVIKQLGLYTDCYGKAHWSEPSEAVEEALTRQILFIANIFLPNKETTQREMELWVEHLSQNWGTSAMFAGALAFQKAMIAEGLGEHTLEEVEQFFLPTTSNS